VGLNGTRSDVIFSDNNAPVEDYRHVQRLVAETGVGKTVTHELLRKRQEVKVSLRIAEGPDTVPGRVIRQRKG
jgi:S1-C subfamily serine protease